MIDAVAIKLLKRLTRIPGSNAAAKLLIARKEVSDELTRSGVFQNVSSIPDSLSPEEIPSVAEVGKDDRVLAEIDQDGFAFAIHPADISYFNRREKKLPKIRYALDVVLYNGRVCVRKKYVGYPSFVDASYKFWYKFGLPFHTEAAALLRLRGSEQFPAIHGINVAKRELYMDYIRGKSMQQWIGESVSMIQDIDLPPADNVDDPERDKREIDAFMDKGKSRYQKEIAKLLRAVGERGVAPLDIKIGNIIIGEKTGRLYWVDFERVSLDSFPRHHEVLQHHSRLVKRWFDITL